MYGHNALLRSHNSPRKRDNCFQDKSVRPIFQYFERTLYSHIWALASGYRLNERFCMSFPELIMMLSFAVSLKKLRERISMGFPVWHTNFSREDMVATILSKALGVILFV